MLHDIRDGDAPSLLCRFDPDTEIFEFKAGNKKVKLSLTEIRAQSAARAAEKAETQHVTMKPT